MKYSSLLIIFSLCFVLPSCYKKATIQVQNNISNVRVTEVKWGNIFIASELLPGEKSNQAQVSTYDEKLPASNTITFVMKANSRSIYLQTEEVFELDDGDERLIMLDDLTKVK